MLRSILTIPLIIAITIGWAVFTPFGASAAPQCGEYDRVTSVLSEKYKEHQIATALTAGGARLEVWQSEGGETWTILVVSNPGPIACIASDGEAWRQIAQQPGTGL